MKSYYGEFTHQLDAQFRISMPSEWRAKNEENEFVLAPTKENALIMMPTDMFENYFERMSNASVTNPVIQKALANFGRFCKKCRCDKQGRLFLDRERLNAVGITSKVVLTGAVTHIRLSAPQNMEENIDVQEAIDALDELNNQLNGSFDNAVKNLVEKSKK